MSLLCGQDNYPDLSPHNKKALGPPSGRRPAKSHLGRRGADSGAVAKGRGWRVDRPWKLADEREPIGLRTLYALLLAESTPKKAKCRPFAGHMVQVSLERLSSWQGHADHLHRQYARSSVRGNGMCHGCPSFRTMLQCPRGQPSGRPWTDAIMIIK